MSYATLLSVSALANSTISITPPSTYIQYFMILMTSGAALGLSRKQFHKMKWRIVKNSLRNLFNHNSNKSNGSGKVGLRVLMIILLVGLGWLIWFLLFGLKKV